MFHTKTQTTDYQQITFLTRSVILHSKNGTHGFSKKGAPAFFSFFFRESKNWDTPFVTMLSAIKTLAHYLSNKKGQQPKPGAAPFV